MQLSNRGWILRINSEGGMFFAMTRFVITARCFQAYPIALQLTNSNFVCVYNILSVLIFFEHLSLINAKRLQLRNIKWYLLLKILVLSWVLKVHRCSIFEYLMQLSNRGWMVRINSEDGLFLKDILITRC